MRTHSLRRRLAAVALLPAVLALGACGMKYDITIHEGETVDVSVLMWGSGLSEEMCSQDSTLSDTGYAMTSTFTEHDGQPACESSATGLTLSQVNGEGDDIRITHEGGLYVLDADLGDVGGQASSYAELDSEGSSDFESTLTVTFPGEVTEASGNAVISGRSVTWNLLEDSGALHAEGKDSARLT